MHVDVVRELLYAQPFPPLTIRLVDGRSLSVPHADFVTISNRQVLYISAEDESVTHLDLRVIVTLDRSSNTTPRPPQGKNGE